MPHKAFEAMTRSIDVANKAVDKTADFIVINLDAITSVSCFIAALGCLYLSSVILMERTPLVHLQRLSLGLLSIALFANAAYDFPDWLLINGHRPTGAAVDFFLMIFVVVSVIRGNLMYQPKRDDQKSGHPV